VLRRWTWISSIVLLAATALWLRGRWARDRVAFDGPAYIIRLENYPHHFMLTVGPRPAALEPGFHADFDIDTFPSVRRYWELRYQRSRNGTINFGIPYWLIVLLSSALPLWAIYSRWTQRRRHREGLCLVCGYDLRASTDRCPECGEPISASPAPAASVP
jgi:hypothetical protein